MSIGRPVLYVPYAGRFEDCGKRVLVAWNASREAARAVMDYGFEVFKLAKVWARADPRNGASVRILEKLEMRCEGLLRGHLLVRGERVDRVYYGILREEWEAGRTASP